VLEALADPEGAALGSGLAGEMYGLPALCEGVQDTKDNATRFVVIAGADAAPTGDDKTTLAFSLDDGPGALRRALGAFEEAGLSLTRIESHPSRERAWSYVFMCDVEGHRTDARFVAALERLRATSAWLKVLGSYPRSHDAPPSRL
jgi:chorismate mutase/prephenate dehydratase